MRNIYELGFIYRKNCHAGNLIFWYKLVHGAPTLTIPLLLRKWVLLSFCNKSRGEEYRIGNVGDLYFFTFWWIQWFAMLGNFWFWYRGLNLESWVDIWSRKDWSSEIGIGQGNNTEKETTESILELLCNLIWRFVLNYQNSPGLNPEFSQIAEFKIFGAGRLYWLIC